MKTYNVTLKKNGNLLLSFIAYDKKVEKKMLEQLKKLKRMVNVVEVSNVK